ncbi:ABC transporter substrate-binding protein [Streptomyces sp. DvalAA-19]|uniref:ABC transporter substrate-binding protein n=1 Tax=Streptomyces sp. DvalAA-19 TaxID=1839761 RepID=UPI00081B76A9|nr:ABC transporter substrate-binding protein [Streptomyces sp. DvalAA-19]SCD88786.1 iron complex transport system substrate-binding protein [Streptomyces sp. DvalAA-19]
MSLSVRRRPLVAAVLASATCLGLLTACSGSSGTGSSDGKAPSAGDGSFPVSLTTAWGRTEVKQKPVRVATVSDGDTSIVLALGLVPVITPDVEDGDPVAEYKQRAIEKLGGKKLKTYDDTDGTDYEAIAAEEPDVILGVNTWDMDTDYAKLSPIAPVVTFADKKQANTLTWQERLKTAAKALGLSEKAEEVIAANEKTVKEAAAAHPEFKGKTYTYSVVHPEQITYMSFADQDPGVFEQLGLVKHPRSRNYTADKDSVSLENLDELEADVLLMTYPFGDEGLLSASELESNKLFRSLDVVKKKHFAVVPSENTLASAIAYPDALSAPWVVENLTPILAKAVAGE